MAVRTFRSSLVRSRSTSPGAATKARRVIALAAAAAGVWGSAPGAGAGTKPGDPGAPDGPIVGGTGNWDPATANWTIDAGVTNTTWTAGTAAAPVDDALFLGTAGTV